jgi:cytoskeletal protein CcmA (bactofilin family)
MAARDTIQFLVGTETAVENARTRVGGTAQVDGRFEGDLVAGHLVVGSDGAFTGTAKAETAEILGAFRGRLSVSGQLTVRTGGDVEGEIAYGALAIDAGGRMVGALSSAADAPAPADMAGANGERIAPGREPASPEPAPATMPAADPVDEPDTDWTIDPDAATAADTAKPAAPEPAPPAKKAPAPSKPARSAKGTGDARVAAPKKAGRAKRPAAGAAKPARKPAAGRGTTDEI